MEVAEIVKKITSEFDGLVNDIVIDLLKNENLHKVTKEAIRQVMRSYKSSFKNACIDESLTNDTDKKNKKLQLVLNTKIRGLFETTEEIYLFEDIEFLDFLNSCTSSEADKYSLGLELYLELKAFSDSGIKREKDYYIQVEKWQKMAKVLQNFSNNKIELDKIPQNPTDTIRYFLHYDCFLDGQGLDIVKYVTEKLKIRTRGNYITKPHPSKKEKQIITVCGSMEKFLMAEAGAGITSQLSRPDEDFL